MRGRQRHVAHAVGWFAGGGVAAELLREQRDRIRRRLCIFCEKPIAECECLAYNDGGDDPRAYASDGEADL